MTTSPRPNRARLTALLGALALLSATACQTTQPLATAPAAPASTPASAPANTPDAIVLPDGPLLWTPDSVPVGAPAPDLLIHFHGGLDTLRREVRLAELPVVVIAVQIGGRSGAYQRPYSEPGRFERLLDDALTALRSNGRLAPNARWRRVYLTSFSAGYGAIRAILSQPDGFRRVDGIYLADSLYAGWKDDRPYSGANPDNMAPFRKFAEQAAAGRKIMLVSHSYYDPQTYAGTHVTADDLIAHLGLQRRPVDEPGPADMRIDSRADKGGFHVWGCRAPRDEHVRHLQNMHFWIRYFAANNAASIAGGKTP